MICITKMLTKQKILNLIAEKRLVIEPFQESVKDASVMLRLALVLRRLTSDVVDTNNLTATQYEAIEMDEAGYVLEPNEFLLVSTHEKVTMPEGYVGWIETRGSLAISGYKCIFVMPISILDRRFILVCN